MKTLPAICYHKSVSRQVQSSEVSSTASGWTGCATCPNRKMIQEKNGKKRKDGQTDRWKEGRNKWLDGERIYISIYEGKDLSILEDSKEL